MNKLVTAFAVWALTVSVTFANTKKYHSDIKVVAVKSHSISFKVSEAFVGGTVEVYDASNNLIHTEGLDTVHGMVRFHEKPSGRYMIKVKKGSKEIEFGYIHI